MSSIERYITCINTYRIVMIPKYICWRFRWILYHARELCGCGWVCVRGKRDQTNSNVETTHKYSFGFIYVLLHSLTFMVDPLSIYKSGAPIISVDGSGVFWMNEWNRKMNWRTYNSVKTDSPKKEERVQTK